MKKGSLTVSVFFLVNLLTNAATCFAQVSYPATTDVFPTPKFRYDYKSVMKQNSKFPFKRLPYERAEFLTNVDYELQYTKINTVNEENEDLRYHVQSRKNLRVEGAFFRKVRYLDENHYWVVKYLPTKLMVFIDPRIPLTLRELKISALTLMKSIYFPGKLAETLAVELKLGTYSKNLYGQNPQYWATVNTFRPASIRISTQDLPDKPALYFIDLEAALPIAWVKMDDAFVKMNQKIDPSICPWCSVGDPNKGWIKAEQSHQFSWRIGGIAWQILGLTYGSSFDQTITRVKGEGNSQIRTLQGGVTTHSGTITIGVDRVLQDVFFKKALANKILPRIDVSVGGAVSTIRTINSQITVQDSQGGYPAEYQNNFFRETIDDGQWTFSVRITPRKKGIIRRHLN